MESSGELVAALCLHGLHVSAVEGVEGQVLYLDVVLATQCHWEKKRRVYETESHTSQLPVYNRISTY